MLAEGQMRRFYQVVVACGLLLLLGACAKTTALEPQDQLLDLSQARIYFFRQTRSPTDMGGFTAADIRIEAATSYYFEIGPAVEMNVAQARLDALEIKGRPVAGRSTASSPFMV